mmetsp:Transcript_17986/g.56276  ORF Transcript_17986/g.56276 Transcript_17986/m.56276 type:complete len:215 (-) Transcript_17986:471-1115(-)
MPGLLLFAGARAPCPQRGHVWFPVRPRGHRLHRCRQRNRPELGLPPLPGYGPGFAGLPHLHLYRRNRQHCVDPGLLAPWSPEAEVWPPHGGQRYLHGGRAGTRELDRLPRVPGLRSGDAVHDVGRLDHSHQSRARSGLPVPRLAERLGRPHRVRVCHGGHLHGRSLVGREVPLCILEPSLCVCHVPLHTRGNRRLHDRAVPGPGQPGKHLCQPL